MPFEELSAKEREALKGFKESNPTPTPSLAIPPTTQPTPVPGAAAPGRQWEIPPALIPSRTQLGIDAATVAAMALAPQAVGGIKAAEWLGRAARPALAAARLALPAIGGALGAKSEGKGALGGAALGAGEQIGSEVVSRLLETPIQRFVDTKKLGNTIVKRFPWLGKVTKARDLERLFVQGEAVTQTGTRLNRTKGTIAKILRNQPVPLSPTMVKVFDEVGAPITHIATATGTLPHATFEEADKALTLLGEMSYLPNGNPRTGITSPELRRLYRSAVDDTAATLNTMRKGLGGRYLKARQEFRDARELKDLFQPVGQEQVITDSGNLNMQALQSRLRAPAVHEAVQSSPRLKDVANTAFRGEKVQAGTDIPFGLNLHLFGTGKGFPEGVVRTMPGKRPIPRRIGKIVRPALRAGTTIVGAEAAQTLPWLLSHGISPPSLQDLKESLPQYGPQGGQ